MKQCLGLLVIALLLQECGDKLLSFLELFGETFVVNFANLTGSLQYVDFVLLLCFVILDDLMIIDVVVFIE